MLYNNSIGIDISRESISIVWLQSRLRGYTLMEQRQLSLAPPEKKQSQDKYGEIAALLNTFISECDIASPAVYLSITDERVIVREIRFPLSVKGNFRDTIRFELEKYVPFSKDHIYYDCQIIAEDKQNNQLVILLVVIKKEDLDPWLQMCKLVDCGVSGIEITSTALANGLAFQPIPSSITTFAYIHRQENKETISLVRNKKLLASRSASCQNDIAAEDLLAHEIKICEENNLLADGLLPVFVDRQENGLAEMVEKGNKLTIHHLKLNESVPSPEFLAAFGLAIRGLQKTPGQINFMPDQLRKRPNRTATTLFYSLIALNLVLILSWTGAGMVRHGMVLDNLNKEIAGLKVALRDLPQLEEKVRDGEKKIEILNDFQHNRPYSVDILKELTSLIPHSAWIDTFHLKDMTVEIGGLADSASDLLPLLESSMLFHDVTFLSTISRTKEGKEKFKIQMGIE